MKVITVFYSFSGKSKKAAEVLAKKRNTDLLEVVPKRKPGKISAYTDGCFRALLGKGTAVTTDLTCLTKYDRIVLIGPVWAGKPAPAVNAVIEIIPAKKEVEIILISGKGDSKSKEKLTEKIRKKGSTLVKYKDMKGSAV